MAAILLLLEDVEDLGRSGDIVKVKPGYARNFLVPRGLGIIADKNALRMQEKLKEKRRLRALQDKTESEEQSKALEGVVVTTTVKVDHEGHMYGSVSAADIVALLEEQFKLSVERKSVQLKQPIKTTGVHQVALKLKEGVMAAFTLKVVSEKGLAEGAAPQEQSSPAA